MGRLESKTLFVYFRRQTWTQADFPGGGAHGRNAVGKTPLGSSPQSLALSHVFVGLLQGQLKRAEDEWPVRLGILPSAPHDVTPTY